MDKRKTAIALLITLMVIATIMSIMAVSFSYLDQARKSAVATSALTQANILYGNTGDIFKRFFPKKADNSMKLKMLYGMPLMLDDEESGFAITLTCQPLMLGTPINWLDDKVSVEKNNLASKIFDAVVELYHLEEPTALEEMIIQAIKAKSSEDVEYISRLKKQKGIISGQQFNKILMNYAFRYDDIKVLDIPWNKYFAFVKTDKKTKIDGAYPSLEFISAAFEIPLEVVKDSWIKGESTLPTFLEDNGQNSNLDKNIYAKKALNSISCRETFLYQKERYGFKFNYTEGRSSNFEFSGQE